MRRIRFALALSAVALVGAGALVGHVIAQSDRARPPVRQPLAQSKRVAGAEGRTLGLSRVMIPPGETIALHHHEGTQAAYIQSGVLTYTVQSGSVLVMDGPADDARVVRKIKGGQTGAILPHQWIIEQPSTIHMATNRGGKKVVIYLATLLRNGAPPSTPN
jgi:hypothetical protein